MNKHLFIISFLCFILTSGLAQIPEFTKQDTLRGSITSERAWWDLIYYHLEVEAFPGDSSIEGSNTVHYMVLHPEKVMQIDLQEPMKITRVIQENKELNFQRNGNVFYINLIHEQEIGSTNSLKIYFQGKPMVTKRPPWDAVMTWTKDNNGNDFFATSCQGEGASTWWPCKDHMYDEADSMLMSYTVPKHLTAVGNGRLIKTESNKQAKTKTYHWFVSNPISNYVVNLNVGDYVHFAEVYNGEKGPLDCDYFVLRYNKDKAKEQFKQVPMMLEAFEYWFGPYPFYEDSYKLVEVPYLGMEHQSSVTYGAGYMNGVYGRDISYSGWGLNFDFIIIHESGHEWFANNITYKDIADMWIHESFTAYSENLYVDYHYGKKASSEYVRGTRQNINNTRPIIGFYDVNYPGSGDMYPKGANMLHNIRQLINDDDKWRSILRGLNEEFYHQTVTTAQIENYINERVDFDLSKLFDQYLRDIRVPVFDYVIKENKLNYRWNNVIDGFNMPLDIYVNNTIQRIYPTMDWKSIELPQQTESFRIDEDYYIIPFDISIKQ